MSGQLDDIRGLRNRITHYEPIVQLDLRHAHHEMQTLTQWLCPDAAAWNAIHSRFVQVCPPSVIIVNGQVDPAIAPIL